MPGILKGLSKLMNESMNTMTEWVKEEWKDRGMAGGGPGDERPGRPEARRTQLEEAGFWVRKGSAAVSAQRPLGRSRNPLWANAARLRAGHVLLIQLSPEHPKAPWSQLTWSLS